MYYSFTACVIQYCVSGDVKLDSRVNYILEQYSHNELCCVLNRCVEFIKPIYCSYQKPEQENPCLLNEQNVDRRGGAEDEDDEDDFLMDQVQGNTSSNSAPISDIFSYSTSPGFKWL